MRTITAYHGSQHGQEIDSIHWFTTCPDHARSHGSIVQKFELTLGSVVETDLYDDERFEGLDGYDVDEAVQRILRDEDVTAVIVSRYEGSGLCILVDPKWVTVEEIA